jgi:hypothetical protein
MAQAQGGAAAAPYGQTQSTIWGPFGLQSRPSKRSGTVVGSTNVSTSCPTGLPSPSPFLLEVSVHAPLPKPLQREVRHVFSGMSTDHNNTAGVQGDDICMAIPTNQRATVDLVSMRGDAVEAEKDRLLNVFMDFASSVCRDIAAANYWADFIDRVPVYPCLRDIATRSIPKWTAWSVASAIAATQPAFAKCWNTPRGAPPCIPPRSSAMRQKRF